MYLTWTKPRGLSSKFKVTWSNGTSNETATPNQTLLNITGLIPGVKYDVGVVAVADDSSTEGEIATDSRYTCKCTIHAEKWAASPCLVQLDQ